MRSLLLSNSLAISEFDVVEDVTVAEGAGRGLISLETFSVSTLEAKTVEDVTVAEGIGLDLLLLETFVGFSVSEIKNEKFSRFSL